MQISSGKEKGANTLSTHLVPYTAMRCFASNLSLLGATSRNRHYLPPYTWENWSTERVSKSLKIPRANLGKIGIWTSLFLVSKHMSIAPVRACGLPLGLPSPFAFSIGVSGGKAQSAFRRQLSPRDPGNPTHNPSNPRRTHFFSKGQRQSNAWRNSVTIHLQLTSISLRPCPDLTWTDSEWWTKLLNHFSVLFPFEGEAGAVEKGGGRELELLRCSGVTQPGPHFLPVVSLQSNCFLLWRHLRDSWRQMLSWLAIASIKRPGQNYEATLVPRILGSASQACGRYEWAQQPASCPKGGGRRSNKSGADWQSSCRGSKGSQVKPEFGVMKN